jgi:Phosphotransferase enzyme family
MRSVPLADPGPNWVALPWSRSPRWFLPREPAAHARSSLSVYHPVTLRSRVGWEAARILAGRGAFRLGRGSPWLPREVWEAAGNLVPTGGGLSMARANHPGRFLALVFDRGGRPVAFVKVARDSAGSRALAAERDALQRFGSFIPAPLVAPRVVSHSEGQLVLEPMEWRARALPWRLPEDVAFALGVFFRNTSSDEAGTGGASHGDFAPWNLLETATGWGLVDWEDSRAGLPPYFDLFHYLVQSNSELRRPSKTAILDGLRLKGWVGHAIGAYAAGAETDARDCKRFLRAYLHESARKLDLEAPPRGARVRSKLLRRLT